ncbi:hypothetical protein G7Y89_g5677 [Cudoniella acicularis]|uniref:THO complex subunit 2 n=1 Tax=Cudoniella acicularis TaxID=354080 RepID=A0A8H4RM08_9HELO|nr:hypothetical protein G7Y89_g5677 [Cudoniella acicularis]
MAPGKRKRPDRPSVDAGENRPSPHRPGNANLAQHDRGGDMRDGGNRRSSRGGQGGAGGGRARRSDDRNNPNKLTISARATPTPGPMSPPPRPSSAAQTPTSTVELPSPIPKREPPPFDYSFLSEARLLAWDKDGRQDVIDAGIRARQDEDVVDLASCFQELIRATLDARLDPIDAGNCVKEILGPDTAPAESSSIFDAQTFFLDTLSMICDAEEPPFNPVLRPFTSATRVSPIVMRQKLDAQLLQNLSLTRDTFIRVGIRQATHLLYRQSNYNLLREETEGYSKLITELFTTSGTTPPSSNSVVDSFERVKGLIGTFDLDVGRVLDIILDVFAAVLIKHCRFFVKLLRVSSWWPRNFLSDDIATIGGLPAWALPSSEGWESTKEDEQAFRLWSVGRDRAFWARAREVGLDAFFELGGRQVVDAENKARIFSSKGDNDAELDVDRKWIEGTGTFPPSGNRVAAQLLGFKLRFYSSNARDKDDVLPANLMYLTALLIKIGFISLRDLYPHLWPLDEDMPAVKEAKLKELAEKERLNRPGGGATNALMTAGALADDTLPNNGRTREAATTKPDATPKAAEDAEDKEKLNEPLDQKVLLLTCLLTIGAIPEALFILGRFPWLPEAYPDLLDLINRIIGHSIKDVYDMCHPLASQDSECPTKKVADLDQSGMLKGQVRLTQIPTRKLLRWPFPAKFDTNDGLSYRFYWDEWADNVPLCQNVDDIFTLCSTFLNISGVNIGRDASLLSKLVRIGAKNLADDRSPQNLERWRDLLKRLLVPALSLTKSNTSVVNEVWSMLHIYPVSVRYSIYAEWFEGQISRLPVMKTAFARTKIETEGYMKRISKTNLTQMARSLAKTAFASPGVVFRVALTQIESYNNLTEVVIECAKYFTDLGYDVLIWSLMSSLGGKDRNRTNEEFALLPSRWLLALARFAGKVFKRYSVMDVSPIIQYVNDQLLRGNSTDLVILKELIAQMAGVVPDTDFTDAQLAAMTGGDLLRRQTLIHLQDKRYESTKTAKRLMKALTETRLAGQLLLAIAQHRQAAIYAIPDEDAHIKLLATMIDDTQMILSQYLDLLRSNLQVDEFEKQVPSISELMTDFGLEPQLAFMIGRASLAHRIAKSLSPSLNGTAKSLSLATETPAKTDTEGDVGMEGSQNGNPLDDAAATKVNDDIQMADATDGSPELSLEPASKPSDPFHDIMSPILATVKDLLPERTWNAISPDFYVTFWTSTLSDLVVPEESYRVEVARLVKETDLVGRDRTDMTRAGMAKREENKKAVLDLQEAILEELRKSVATFTQVRARLLKRKSGWFEHALKPDTVSDLFLEKCLIPRLLLSPSDADFCFRMIRFLHDNGTPNFRTLSLYGRIFRAHRLRSIVFTCTVREAENLGRFLRLVLADLARWHGDAATFEKEAWGKNKNLPGFAKALDRDGTPRGFLSHAADGEISFKSLLLSWHKNLNTALRECLEGTEWMHIRNAITVLKSVAEVFPAVDFMGNGFIKQLEAITIREKGSREDLSLTGNAVLVQLKKRSKNWVMVQGFGYNLSKPTNGNAIRSTSQASAASSKTALKPTAPEFKPQSRASSLGVATPKPVEVEDGEVDDAKLTSAKSTNASKSTPESSASNPAASASVEPKKSDVLLRREQFQRENAAKFASSHSNIPPRPITFNSSDRRPHNLPTRPDAPIPSQQLIDRHRHSDRRDIRDPRLPDSGRMDRPGDRLPRDYPPSDRRGIEPNSREFGRPSDRNSGSDRRTVSGPEPPPRWTPDSARENLERNANASRAIDNSGRLSRENGMPPPRSSGLSSDRAPVVNSDRVPPSNPERQEIINPERAALISNTVPRSESPRRPREDTRDHPSSRPQSPRRQTERDHTESRRDDRSSRNGPDASRGARSDDVLPPPAGPRSERPSDRGSDRADRSAFQPPFQATATPPRPIDLDHGRLNSGMRQQADPNFGRLNTGPTHDIPSGPRDRNSRGNRISSGPRRDERTPLLSSTNLPRPPTPEKQPPTGPSSGRHPRRSASGQFDTISNLPGSAPTTPSVATPAPPIHPDRLKQLGSQAVPPPPPPPPPSVASVPPATGIHPDRLRSFGNETPSKPPIHVNQSSGGRGRPPMPSVVTGGPPSGPKGAQSSPITSGSNGLAPPTGPASATERAARSGRRQLTGINSMLQQAGAQNGPERMNVRGRGRVNAMGQPDTPTSNTSPILPPPPPPPASGRPDLREVINPDRADLITGNVPSSDDRDKDRSARRERSGRHSRRSSRSPDRTRDTKRIPGEDDRSSRGEHRERRGGEREGERERHQGRSPHRSSEIPGRDPGTSSRESGRDRDRERESGRREGRERHSTRETHDASWTGERPGERPSEGTPSGRSRDMREGRGEERRETRGSREDSGRKRRSDEGMMDARGHEKRPRRM